MPSAPWSLRFPIFLPVNSSFCRWQRPQITCEPRRSRLYQRSRTTGRFRSGQTEQTVNLLALRLRWFESSPAHFPRLDYFRRLLLRFRAGDFLPLFEAFAVFRFFPRAGRDFFFGELRDLVDALERAAFAFDFEELAFFELVLADFFATDFASFFAFLTTFLAFGSKRFSASRSSSGESTENSADNGTDRSSYTADNRRPPLHQPFALKWAEQRCFRIHRHRSWVLCLVLQS